MPDSNAHGIWNIFSQPSAGAIVPSQAGHSRSFTDIDRSQVSTAIPQAKQAKQDRRRRVIAYYTHAVVNFHTFGIPLSGGLILEYCYNGLFLTVPLDHLALVCAIQWIGIFAMEWLAASAFEWKHWRWVSVSVTVVFLLCQAILARGARPWTLALGMRALEGFCLGFLRSTALQCLASHYNDNIAAVSMQSGAAAMLGTLIYSLMAWAFLRKGDYKKLAWAEFYIALFGLSPALAGFFLASRVDESEVRLPRKERSIPRLRHRSEKIEMRLQTDQGLLRRKLKYPHIEDYFLISGLFLIVAFQFVWPTFFPLLFTSFPIYEYPEYASYWFFTTFIAATITSTFFARPWPRRGLGVVNTFAAAGIFAGSSVLVAAWVPNFWIWGVVCVVYGLCLGPLLALHRKVFDLLGMYWKKAGILSTSLGFAVFGGISLAGLMIQKSGGGSIALTVSGVAMIVGGGCMAVGRWLKYPTKYVVI